MPRSSQRCPTRRWEAGPDPTTAICEYNVEGEWELGREVTEVSLGGSRTCTVSIPGRGLSARHCLLERRAHALRLHDLDSSHGTFVRWRKLDGSADLHPGDTFTARPMTFVCLNEEMRQHRPTLFEILGSGAPRCPDWVLVQAATGSGPLLFTGEAGCDLDLVGQLGAHLLAILAVFDEQFARNVALRKQVAEDAGSAVTLGMDEAAIFRDQVARLDLASAASVMDVLAIEKEVPFALGDSSIVSGRVLVTVVRQ